MLFTFSLLHYTARSFFKACAALNEESAVVSRIETLRSPLKETQHSRPVRPIQRMPNTRQHIFLQFCGFSAWQCDINSYRLQHEAIKKSHNSPSGAAGRLVYCRTLIAALSTLLISLILPVNAAVANFLTGQIDRLSEVAHRPPLDARECNSIEWHGLLTSEIMSLWLSRQQ